MTNSLAKRVIQTRAGGRVERCHTIPHTGSYSVAAHSWGVAMLMFYLWPEDFPRLAAHCLSHDVPEAWVGDIPSPMLRYNPELKKRVEMVEAHIAADLGLPSEFGLSSEDYAKLKACDALEFWLWSREQIDMGNRFAIDGLHEVERHFAESPLPTNAWNLYSEFKRVGSLPRQRGIIKEVCDVEGK